MRIATVSSLLALGIAGLAYSLTARAAETPAATTPPAATNPLERDPRQPNRVPISWELTFKHGNLERVTVPVDGKDQTFWFMRYTIVNNAGRDILFTPNFEILAESGTSVAALKIVPAAVFDKIKSMYNNPLLLSPINIDGKLLQGEDNAKDSVAIFPELDPNSRNFALFVMGLSGETSEVMNPIKKQPVILQKTLQLDYNLPGQAVGIPPQSRLMNTKWVMK
jgi:hypothetical protein